MDRSPCGTGTSAKLASDHAKGRLKPGRYTKNIGSIGTQFIGGITSLTRVAQYDAVVPEIKTTAFITGYSRHVLDRKDPLMAGFKVRD